MIKSMTGYGKAVCELKDKTLTVEVKSLNNKFLDLNIKLPNYYKEKELEFRDLLSKKLERGRVDLSIFADIKGEVKNYSINKALVKAYHKELSSISKDLKLGSNDYMKIILDLPDVLSSDKKGLDQREWKHLNKTIIVALKEVEKFRLNEGRQIEKDIVSRVEKIKKLQKKLDSLEEKRKDCIKIRLNMGLEDIEDSNNIDKERFEQEMIYYIEKIDITEEKVRLTSHCDYFLETLKEKKSNGKKLGFITQEMGREINTIGSKANNADIQKIVVEMKDELEKIKEQVMNVL